MRTFIGGYVARSLLKSIGVCATCRNNLVATGTNEVPQDTGLIIARSYKPSLLLQPKTTFMRLFSRSCEILHIVLPEKCLENNLMDQLLGILTSEAETDIVNSFHCKQHSHFGLFVPIFAKFYVHTWIKNVNRILRGVDNTRKNVLNDKVKILANTRFQKYARRNAAIRAAKKLA